MFLPSKYTRWYWSIIEQARVRPKPRITCHQHHIIPKSLNGSNHPSNLVFLTLREHYVCHWLLTRMTTGEAQTKMVCAFARFRSMAPSAIQWSRSVKTLKGLRNPFYGRRHSEEARRKISLNHGMRGRSCYDVWVGKYGVLEADIRKEEMLLKRSQSLSGPKNPMYGVSRTEDQKKEALPTHVD